MRKKKKPGCLIKKKVMISKWTPASHRKISTQIHNKLLIVIISWARVLKETSIFLYVSVVLEVS